MRRSSRPWSASTARSRPASSSPARVRRRAKACGPRSAARRWWRCDRPFARGSAPSARAACAPCSVRRPSLPTALSPGEPMPPPELALQLLGDPRQGRVRSALGRAFTALNRLTGRAQYDRERLERVHGTSLWVLPSVFNPRVLRTGAFFAAVIAKHRLGEQGAVLDLGTGSGVC